MAVIDKELIRRALLKRQAGEKLTYEEKRAVRKYENDREASLRREFYAAVPIKDVCEMSGRQHKVIGDHARLYGAPLLGPAINLNQFFKWYFDFFAANGRKLVSDDDLLVGGSSTPALERLREASADLKELELAKQKNELLDREKIHTGHALIASRLREMGDRLQRDFGREAHQIVVDTLHEIAREVDHMLVSGPDDSDDAPPGENTRESSD